MMQTADLVRAKTFNIRFSEEELARLDAVAQHYALTAAGLIRMLVKREADAIRPVVPPPSPVPPIVRTKTAKKR